MLQEQHEQFKDAIVNAIEGGTWSEVDSSFEEWKKAGPDPDDCKDMCFMLIEQGDILSSNLSTVKQMVQEVENL